MSTTLQALRALDELMGRDVLVLFDRTAHQIKHENDVTAPRKQELERSRQLLLAKKRRRKELLDSTASSGEKHE